MNEYETLSRGASTDSIITVQLTTIILNEIYLTLKNLKGLDLLYIIGMFWDVYFLSCGSIFFYCSFFSGVPVPKSLCEGDVMDIVFLTGPQSDIWS